MSRTSPRLIIQVLAILGLIVSVFWFIKQPSFESILAFLVGIATLLSSFFVSEEPISSTRELFLAFMPNNRKKLLQKVKLIWIRGVFEPSLPKGFFIQLDIKNEQSWINTPIEKLKTSTANVLEAYYEFGGELLILGEPGSGKTTLLLEIANALLASAARDDSAPIPVVLNLVTWTQRKQSLHEWIIEELRLKYQAPKPITFPWIINNQLVFLLDGLDEVPQQDRQECINAINTFRQDYGFSGMVVCSRIDEYKTANEKLKLSGAVVIQPLNKKQIVDFLMQLREQEKLSNMLQDVDYDLMKSPLFLGLLISLDSDGIALDNQPISNTDKVLNAYIKAMLSKAKNTVSYEGGQTIKWLTSIARKLTQENETVFMIDNLQPSWLEKREQIVRYALISRLIVGIILGLILWPFVYVISFFGGYPSDTTMLFYLSYSLIFGLIVSIVNIASFLYSRFLINGFLPNILKKYQLFLIGTLGTLLFAWVSTWKVDNLKLESNIFNALFIGFLLPFLARQILNLRPRMKNTDKDIETIEQLYWSWNSSLRGAIIGFVAATVLALLIFQLIFLMNALFSSLIIVLSIMTGVFYAILALLLSILIVMTIMYWKSRNFKYVFSTNALGKYKGAMYLCFSFGFIASLIYKIIWRSPPSSDLAKLIMDLKADREGFTGTVITQINLQTATFLLEGLIILAGIGFILLFLMRFEKLLSRPSSASYKESVFRLVLIILKSIILSFAVCFIPITILAILALYFLNSDFFLLNLDILWLFSVCILIGSLISGFSHKTIQEKAVSNYGIKASLYNSSFTLLISVLLITFAVA